MMQKINYQHTAVIFSCVNCGSVCTGEKKKRLIIKIIVKDPFGCLFNKLMKKNPCFPSVSR